MRFWLCLLLLQTGMAFAQASGTESPPQELQAGPAPAAPAVETPVIRDITFSGNKTTQPKVMLREMSVHVGEPADEAAIEHSRQAIQDLGLFKSVKVTRESLPDGIRLIFVVEEKFFLLPYPRLSANVDQQYSYGAELEWNNFLGLNQSIQLIAARSDANRDGYGQQTKYSASYYVPFINDSHENLALSVSHSTTPMTNTSGDPYTEALTSAQALLTRTFSSSAASQGWTVGGGLLYQNENRYGIGAAPPYGEATALVGTLEYRDLHLNIYSEEGTHFTFRQESAIKGLLSDYGYTTLRANYDRYIPIGDVKYQTLQLSTAWGASYNEPEGVQNFSLGGGSGLRGFPSYSFNGNSFYYLATIYQRPVGWDWLRVMAAFEAGNAVPNANSVLFRNVSTDIALGFRLRIAWFIDLQFEAGWAIPLSGDSKGRFFGGRL